jgi:hypothetical protein
MKFGSLTGLCEKLKNPKYEISVTSGYPGRRDSSNDCYLLFLKILT